MTEACEGISIILATKTGDAQAVSAALKDPLTDPNITDKNGCSALIAAAGNGLTSVVRELLSDPRVDRNIKEHHGFNACLGAAYAGHASVVELLLADARTMRIRPSEDQPSARAIYDSALKTVKQQRNKFFKGLIRFIVLISRRPRNRVPGTETFATLQESADTNFIRAARMNAPFLVVVPCIGNEKFCFCGVS